MTHLAVVNDQKTQKYLQGGPFEAMLPVLSKLYDFREVKELVDEGMHSMACRPSLHIIISSTLVRSFSNYFSQNLTYDYLIHSLDAKNWIRVFFLLNFFVFSINGSLNFFVFSFNGEH